jgi:hypothetical protein
MEAVRSKFADAVGIGKSRVHRSVVVEDPLSIIFWAEESWVDGKAIVELEKVADQIKFQVVIEPAEIYSRAVRIEMRGPLQACIYSDVEE